jgi:hypothetical protein
MPRTRSVKPEFWSDEKLARLSRDSRLTYVGLWSTSDDYGVTKGHPAWLKCQLFPYDDDLKLTTFEKWLKELESIHRIVPFNVNGEIFYYITHFQDHQKVDHPSKLRNPEPPESIINIDSRNTLEPSRDSLDETDTDTDTDTDTKEKSSRLCASTPDFISQLKEIYAWIDVDTEIQKMKGFLLTPKGKGRKLTHAFAVRWLNRVDKPIDEKKPAKVKGPKPKYKCDICGDLHEVGTECPKPQGEQVS